VFYESLLSQIPEGEIMGKDTHFDSLKRKTHILEGVCYILIGLVGEKWVEDKNLKDTPDRVVRALEELCQGLYKQDEIDEILSKTFPSDYDEMIVVTNIDAVGLCPHHLMPIRYKIHVGYIPSEDGQVLGLSKIPRLVCLLAARPILQEQLTVDIVNAFEKHLQPLGVMVVVNGGHSCMQCRGVKQASSQMITSAVRGCFADEEDNSRNEFLSFIRS